jgi:Ankyrin repeats (3 copies)
MQQSKHNTIVQVMTKSSANEILGLRKRRITAKTLLIAIMVCVSVKLCWLAYDYSKIYTRLVGSAAVGNNNRVKELLQEGADIHAHNDEALMVAAREGHTDVVKTLFDSGADIYADRGVVVYQAILSGNPDTVRFVLEKGGIKFGCKSWYIQSAEASRNQEIINMVQIELDKSSISCPGDPPSHPQGINTDEINQPRLQDSRKK